MIALTQILQAVAFGLSVIFILLGAVGTIIPIIPGTFLAHLTILLYAVFERSQGLAALDGITLVVLTLIALVTGLADLWLPWLGAKSRGTSRRAIALGLVGGIIGTLFAPLIGTIIGYGLGILIGEYHKVRDWQLAFQASVNGLAHWGVAALVQLSGVLMMLLIFVWQVLIY
jgi:uncharacterized protein YqgC (DUF456 family)